MSPILLSAHVVTCFVCGIIFTVNKFLLTSLTVRDVPFNAIDPFFAINLIRLSGHSKMSLSLLSTFSQFTSFATPSI